MSAALPVGKNALGGRQYRDCQTEDARSSEGYGREPLRGLKYIDEKQFDVRPVCIYMILSK